MMNSDSSLHTGTRQPMRILKHLVLPIVLRQFSALLSIGDANQRYLETYGVPRERIFRVPNMVDEGFWARREGRTQTRADMRARLGFTDDDFVVLYVGKLIERKRPADLVAAADRLRSMAASRRRVTIMLAGDGAQRQMLEREVTAKNLPVRLLGFVNIDTLPDYYCAADALAHPAEREVFGVITVEAAILGLPMVLSDHVGAIGPTSIARPSENTLVHPCGDIDALARALHKLADEPDVAARMAAASRRISEELDWRKSVGGFVDAVNYCVSRWGRNKRSQAVGD
jgi:glycosyltransferase involved in cell wall biosynthesis